MSTVPPSLQPPTIFPGFDQPHQNWFKMPYAWTDMTAKVTSLAELKVVEYVLKHTWGYQEYDLKKKISIDEFMHGRKRKDGSKIDQGTGLSKQSVIDGLKNAVKHGFLEVEKDDSDQARKKRYYSLRMQDTDDKVPPEPADNFAGSSDDRGGETPSDQPDTTSRSGKKRAEVKNLDADVKHLDISSQASRHRSEKDTLERYFNNNSGEQSTVKQAVVDVLIAEGVESKTAHQLVNLDHVTLDFVHKQIDQRNFLYKNAPERVKRPIAFLVSAIQRAYPEPDGYIPQATREAEAAAKRQQAEERRGSQIQMERQIQEEQAAQQHALTQKRQTENARLAQLQTAWETGEEENRLWQQVLTMLEVQLKSTIGYGLIEHSVLLSAEKGSAVVALPNPWAKEYVAQRLSPFICQALAQQLGEQAVHVTFIAPDSTIIPDPPSQSSLP